MWKTNEYVDPFNKNDPDFWINLEHIGRYIFAQNFTKYFSDKLDVIIDAGCGNGYGTWELSRFCQHVFGLDNNHKAIEHANEHYKKQNITFQRFDFKDSLVDEMKKHMTTQVDIVVAFEFLEHLENPTKTLEELNIILKKNGYLICSVPNPRFESISDNGEPTNEFHKQIFSYEEITNLITRSGFSILKSLGQPMINTLLKRETKLIRKKKMTVTSSDIKAFHDEETMRYFALMFAQPEKENIDKSYSFIFIARKN